MPDVTEQNGKQQRALFVTSVLPVRNGAGIFQRAYRNLELVSDRFSVDLLLLARVDDDSRAGDLPVRRILRLSSPFADPPAWVARIPGGSMIWRFTRQLLEVRTIGRQPGYQSVIETIGAERYHLAFFFRLKTLPVLRQITASGALHCEYTIVDFDDIESKSKLRSLKYSRAALGWQKWISIWLDAQTARHRESAGLRLANEVWVSSEQDRNELLARPNIHADVLALPNTIHLPNRLGSGAGNLNILFVGLLDYFPNADAMTFFTSQAWPAVRAHFGPAVTLTIAGQAPPAAIRALDGQQGIRVTGWVDDLQPLYEAAGLVVVPIRFGGGTRIKILEAMAYGRLVVSTTVGCEGLDAGPGTELVVADSGGEIAAACIEYLANPGRRVPIEDAARRFVETRYGFDLALNLFRARRGN